MLLRATASHSLSPAGAVTGIQAKLGADLSRFLGLACFRQLVSLGKAGEISLINDLGNASSTLHLLFPSLVVAVLEGKETSRSTLDNALKTHAACMMFVAADVK